MQRILATGICVQNVRSARKLFAAVYDPSMSNRTFAPLILSYYGHLGDPKIALCRGVARAPSEGGGGGGGGGGFSASPLVLWLF